MGMKLFCNLIRHHFVTHTLWNIVYLEMISDQFEE